MFSELLIPNTEEGIIEAAALISSGELVAFPTETVYGLGANALNEAAVRSIFTAKGRPLTDPLIVHVWNKQLALELLDLLPTEKIIFDVLASFWPGPLTLIAKAQPCIPMAVTAETGFVGVRIPCHPLANALLKACNLPIAAPSANRFGHVSPTRADHVLLDLGSKGVRVLNGDSEDLSESTCHHGIESTVAKIDGTKKQIIIFRQGAITQCMMEKALKESATDWTIVVVTRTVKMHATVSTSNVVEESGSADAVSQDTVPEGQEAPGQAVTHYAPDVPCVIVSHTFTEEESSPKKMRNELSEGCSISDDSNVLALNSEDLCSVVVIDFNGQLQKLEKMVLAYKDLSPTGSSSEAARHLFEFLRWSESVSGAKRVLLPTISNSLNSVAAHETADTPGHNKLAAENETAESISNKLESIYDLTLGLADRIFRAASGVIVTLHIHS